MKRRTGSDDLVPIVDVFAGSGGLGEGYARFSAQGNRKFRLALSVEKDPLACRTLRLRAFARCFDPPSLESLACLEGEISEAELFDH